MPPTSSSRSILHIAQSSEGGAATVVTGLVGGQRARGDRVVVACLPGSRLAARAARAGAEVLVWDARRAPGPWLPHEVAAVRRVVDSARPDVVHLHSSKAGLAGRIALRGRLPTVFQPHAWAFDAVTGLLRVATVRWERTGARWTHRLVCVSEAEREQGEAAGVRAPYVVIPNGVDLDHFDERGGSARAAARRRLGVAPAAPLAVCVGRLCRQKGQDVLLRSWEDVVDRVPAVRLALVGDGPDRETLRERASAAVVFAGAVEDPRDWYLAADLVVLPSRWEGMALAPLEAMAAGRPVVVTDVAGAREALPPDHAARSVVPPDDPRALSEAVASLLSDQATCAALGRQARTHVRRHHGVDQVVEHMSTVYEAARGAWEARTGRSR
ncbi:glycosyltransferase family 4 protein [Streptomyces sp. YS415]|uniref:glycosyltransferase family 4 protein n=1 Tax=Streptomyces sp. YS415 TaxID=2944806 RepID=UPI0020205431|nr:glycosyltransferase family 4 protein [Streptomyces sp. YS415]MCL7425873.1 glycosyltransferase family 4 protein [Streptomyces sp. YS415]